MAIPEAYRSTFLTLLRAAANGDLALVECRNAATAEARHVLRAVARNGGGYALTPFEHLCDGDPFDAYLPSPP
jgi:hypothetical protein